MHEEFVPPKNYKDRHIGLIVYGILIIIVGCLSGLAALLILAIPLLPNLSGQELPSMRFMLPGILLYGGLSVTLIWLGIGSTLCRRWARTLLLVLGWFWLGLGLVMMINMAFMMPMILAQQHPGVEKIPPALKTFIMMTSAVFESIIYVIIPAAIAFFYKSPHVKATCEARNPATPWTDACPTPVLALSVFTAFSALMVAIMLPSFNGVVPFFGTYLTGLPGMGVMLIVVITYAFASRACYKLQLRGWWALVIVYGLSTTSFLITYVVSGVFRMYELIGFPASQLASLKAMNTLQSPMMWVMSVIVTIPIIGYIVFTKRYFNKIDD